MLHPSPTNRYLSSFRVPVITNCKRCLCTCLLASSALAVNAVERGDKHRLGEVMSNATSCIADLYKSIPEVSVNFVHGDVFDRLGQPITSGSVLSVDDVVHAGANGFLSIHGANGETVNIQPNTSTSIACALVSEPVNLGITQPYTVGAFRG